MPGKSGQKNGTEGETQRKEKTTEKRLALTDLLLKTLAQCQLYKTAWSLAFWADVCTNATKIHTRKKKIQSIHVPRPLIHFMKRCKSGFHTEDFNTQKKFW